MATHELRVVGYRWQDAADEVLCRDCWWRMATDADTEEDRRVRLGAMPDVLSSEPEWRLMFCEECGRELGEAVDGEESEGQ